MSAPVDFAQACGQVGQVPSRTVNGEGELRHNIRMIFPRLISIAIRKYASLPEERGPAVRMLLRNAIRLCIAHLGAQETAAIALETLAEEGRRT
jgi:hypothetical protein